MEMLKLVNTFTYSISMYVKTKMPSSMCRWLLMVFKEGHCKTSLDSLCENTVTHTVKKVFLNVWVEPPVFLFVTFASRPVTGHDWKSLASSSLHPHFSRLTRASSQPHFIGGVLSSLHHFFGPSLNSIQFVHFSLVLESLELDLAHTSFVKGE